jgi:hypothetical protein
MTRVSISLFERYMGPRGWEWQLHAGPYTITQSRPHYYTTKEGARRAAKRAAKELGFALRGEQPTTKETTP